MVKLDYSIFLAGALVALATGPASAASILKPVSAAVYSGGTSVGSVMHLIDGSGMSLKYKSGQDYQAYIASNVVHTNDANTIWRSAQPSTSSLLMFDFGEAVELAGFTVWADPNSSISSLNFGIYNIPGYPMFLNLAYATSYNYSGNGSGMVGNSSVIPRTSFGQTVTARYFGIQINGCDNVQALTDGCGLGEVVFRSTRPVAISGVPEPKTWASLLLGMGAVGAAMRRRNAAMARSVNA